MVSHLTGLPAKRLLLCCLGVVWLMASIPMKSRAQSIATTSDTATVVIRTILLTGNKKTKPYIIYRELPFKEGKGFRCVPLMTTCRRHMIN